MTALQVGHDAEFYDVAGVADDDVWAVGIYRTNDGQGASLVERWTGTAWSVVASPRPGTESELRGVAAISANDIWAVGSTRPDQVSKPRALIEHWDGSSWSVISSPAPAPRPDVDPRVARVGLTDVVALAPDDVWAVGNADGRTLIEHWDGAAWTIVPSPNPGGYYNALLGVAAVAPGDIWAVGTYLPDSASSTPSQDLIEHWDGNAWSVVPASSGSLEMSARSFSGVTAIAAADVWAVGGYETGHWDGTSWTITPTSFPPNTDLRGGQLYGVAAFGSGDVWAVGSAGRIAHWDGSAWSAIPVPSLLSAWPGSSAPRLYGAAATPSGTVWAVGNPDGSRPAAARLCPVRVSESGFSETSASSSQGSGVAWSLPTTNAQAHSVTDASGLGLFDSGLRAPGSSFTTTLIAAGKYTVRDTASGNTSTIKVPLKVSPASGSTATSFTLTWASEAPPPGYAIDVQVKRPPTTAYDYVRKKTTETSGSFLPDTGPGTYSFRARYRNTQTFGGSGWSSAVTITVT